MSTLVDRKPIVIKWPLKRLGVSGVQWKAPDIPGYVFTHDPACAEYDWLVVYDEFPFGSGGTIRRGVERLRCPRAHTILLTQEPVALKHYGWRYTHQFGHLITSRPPEAENHPHYHRGQGYYVSCRGETWAETLAWKPQKKTRLISAVCSAKAMRHTQHWQRYALMRHLSARIPELDWFGLGVKTIPRKRDALDGYKYHVAAENVIAPGHWTEKISDALLSECLPFYAGDPDLWRVLPPDCFIPIPLDDPGEAARIITEAIRNDEYARRLPAIREARRLIVEKYNTYSQIISVIEAEKDAPATPPGPSDCILSRHRLRWHPGEMIAEAAYRLQRTWTSIGKRSVT